MLNVEERILDYVGRCYGERGQVPSVREILDDMNVSRYRFYLIFPNGIGGVCNALGLPIPMDGMRRTRSASDARRAKERKDLSEKYGDLHLRYSVLLKEANALKEEAARLREENASLNQRAGGLRYEVEELKRERDHLAKRLNEVSVNMSLSGEAVREAERREKMLRMELEKLRNELISCTSTTAPRLLNAIESRLKKEEEELARIVDEEVKRHGLLFYGFNDAKAASKEMIKRIFTVIRGELQLEPKYIEPQLIMEFKAFLKMKGTLILT